VKLAGVTVKVNPLAPEKLQPFDGSMVIVVAPKRRMELLPSLSFSSEE
jgi:hypothetical protein